jgi:hypothetical protein
MILIVDDIVSDDEINMLLSKFETGTPTKEYSREVNSLARVYNKEANAGFVDLNLETDVQQIANDKTNIMVGKYKDYIEELGYFDTHGLISNLEYSHKYRIIKYDTGQSFHDHVDKSLYTFGSCSLALNDDYEGGEYRFFRGGHKVKLKKGQGMIWPADHVFVHGVNTVTKGCKYTVNSFLGLARCVANPRSLNLFRHQASGRSSVIFAANPK